MREEQRGEKGDNRYVFSADTAGELEAIREQFKTDADREKATQQFMDDLDDRHTEEACPEALDKAARVTSLSAMLSIVGTRYR